VVALCAMVSAGGLLLRWWLGMVFRTLQEPALHDDEGPWLQSVCPLFQCCVGIMCNGECSGISVTWLIDGACDIARPGAIIKADSASAQ
jgi:hypothetical protein